jgi:hypothetical protein
VFLFESSWKKPYSDRGVRKILARYTQAAGIAASISPHTLRHFLFTWLKTQGIDDALVQPTTGTPPASPWRSTPASPWPRPSSATTTPSAISRPTNAITLVWA